MAQFLARSRGDDRMRRRDFIGVICGTALAVQCSAAAQQPGKVWRIGQVLATPPEVGEPYAQALEQRLADLGYVQGRNVVLLDRFTGAQTAKIEEAIVALVPQVDLLVLWGNAATVAKKLAEGAPTVFISVGFPVELGLVQSLAHPGRNMTGIAAEAASEINGKRLQILKEIVPDVSRVAVLRDVAEPTAVLWSYGTGFEWTAMNQAARKLGLSLVPVDVRSADELEAAFADMKKGGAEALFLTRTALVFNAAKQIADLAIAAHLLSCHPFREGVIAGGLVSLDADRLAMARPAAAQIDKIIKGASPADIPVEQPTKFDLYINLKTARLLNMTIPPNVLALADHLIE
jgi:putative tryptophan/tyrosine transport system substrate-binding protein